MKSRRFRPATVARPLRAYCCRAIGLSVRGGSLPQGRNGRTSTIYCYVPYAYSGGVKNCYSIMFIFIERAERPAATTYQDQPSRSA